MPSPCIKEAGTRVDSVSMPGNHQDDTRLSGERLLIELERARRHLGGSDAGVDHPSGRLIDRLTEQLQDGFSLLSPSGVHLDVNAAMCTMLGYAHDELVGTGVPHLYWPAEEREHITRELQRCVDGDVSTREITFVRKNGEHIPVLLTPSVIRDEAGDPVCVFSVIKDISAQKQQEQALRMSEARLARAQEVGRVGSWEYDPKTTRFWGSAEARRIFGLDPEVPKFSTEEIESTTPERRMVHQALLDLIEKGKRFDLEYQIIPRGSSAPRWVWSVADVERDQSGDPVLVTGVIQDVTERRHAQDAERESERRYRSLFEDSPVAMWEQDETAVKAYLDQLAASGIEDVIAYLLAHPDEYARCLELAQTLDANKAAIELFEAGSREELLANNSKLYRRAGAHGIHLFWAAMLAGERTATYEETNFSLRGSEIRVLETGTVVPGHEKTYDRVYYADVDITERHRKDEALRESEARYRSVVENAPVGMIQATPAGRLVYANPACAQLFGCASPEQLLEFVNGAGAGEVLYADPEARRQVLEEAHAAGGAWIAIKARLRHADGDYHTDVVHLCERRDPISGEVSLYGFLRDVSAEEAAEKALQHSAYLLGQGEGLAHLGSWEWDVTAGMSTVSKEWQRIHGLVGDHVSDGEIIAVCHEEDREKLRRALEETAAGRLYRVDHRVVHPVTREVRHLMTYGEPVRGAEGRVRSVVGASLDVTERVRAEEVLREREEHLRRALDTTVTALGATVAMRDPYTADHERRVAALAARIAERLGWSEQSVERVRTAALVHDVGKIIVPAEILSKPGRLADAEFALIKAHAAAGHELLAPIEFDGPVAEIVLQHHERLDGTGYPRGLHGDEILPCARVLAVADVVEAMTAHRPYRAALSLDQAIAEIEDGLGRRYDAEVGAACLEMLREPGFTLGAD